MNGMHSTHLLIVTTAAMETHPTVMAVFHAFSSTLLLFICCNLKKEITRSVINIITINNEVLEHRLQEQTHMK
jgi:hypothetical protein